MAHAILLRAESPEPQSAAAIRQVLDDQVAAWNRGDIETFMHAYKDSPDTTFIGKSIEHGYVPILERYKKAYASKDAMGTLDFSDLAVRELGANYAVVTGKFHLARNAAGGGDVERHLLAGLGEDSGRDGRSFWTTPASRRRDASRKAATCANTRCA